MPEIDWKFTEEQRPAVCRGELCPMCLTNEIEVVGCTPDGFNMNHIYKCASCGERWEGY